jgi:ATP adenylyltransferase
MDKLWAPWRMKYIQGVHKETGCIFCTKPGEDDDRGNLLLKRGRKAYVLMNLYPYNNGHLIVVPYLHTCHMDELDTETVAEMWELCRLSISILTDAFCAEGFNVGLNLGRVAGAGIDQHIHMHIVPRWNGDTNFMPVTGQTKVISQSLEEAYEVLAPHFQGTA